MLAFVPADLIIGQLIDDIVLDLSVCLFMPVNFNPDCNFEPIQLKLVKVYSYIWVKDLDTVTQDDLVGKHILFSLSFIVCLEIQMYNISPNPFLSFSTHCITACLSTVEMGTWPQPGKSCLKICGVQHDLSFCRRSISN